MCRFFVKLSSNAIFWFCLSLVLICFQFKLKKRFHLQNSSKSFDYDHNVHYRTYPSSQWQQNWLTFLANDNRIASLNILNPTCCPYVFLYIWNMTKNNYYIDVPGCVERVCRKSDILKLLTSQVLLSLMTMTSLQGPRSCVFPFYQRLFIIIWIQTLSSLLIYVIMHKGVLVF